MEDFLRILLQSLVTTAWIVVLGRVLMSWIDPQFEKNCRDPSPSGRNLVTGCRMSVSDGCPSMTTRGDRVAEQETAAVSEGSESEGLAPASRADAIASIDDTIVRRLVRVAVHVRHFRDDEQLRTVAEPDRRADPGRSHGIDLTTYRNADFVLSLPGG